MALSWSDGQDRSICRTRDCAIVFNAIYGPDGKDQTSMTSVYYPPGQASGPEIGYLKRFDSVKENQGYTLRRSTFLHIRSGARANRASEYPTNDLHYLSAEAAAAFERVTRSTKTTSRPSDQGCWPTRSACRVSFRVESTSGQPDPLLLIQDMQAS